MIKLSPNISTTLPAHPRRIEWVPAANKGMRLHADLSPRGEGHLLSWELGIHRTYESGKEILGTAARARLHIIIASHPLKGWMGTIEGDHTAKLILKGEGDLASAVAAIDAALIPYAKSLSPYTIGSGTAIPAALMCPSGGELIAL